MLNEILSKEKQTVWNSANHSFERKFTLDKESLSVQVTHKDCKLLEVNLGGTTKTFEIVRSTLDELNFHQFIFNRFGDQQVFCNGVESYITIHEKVARFDGAATMSEGSLQSPMPGKIFKIVKEKGSSVKAGETVMIVEAMKMEHAIKATKDGNLSEIFFKEGDQVQGGVALCEIN